MHVSARAVHTVSSDPVEQVIEMITILTILSALAVLLLFGALAYFLVQIIAALESIGGKRVRYGNPSSYLSKIAFGVRAIEQQTGHLGPEVTRLNTGLARAAEGLDAIDENLVATIEAVQEQEGRGHE